jgi:hypothetical protein
MKTTSKKKHFPILEAARKAYKPTQQNMKRKEIIKNFTCPLHLACGNDTIRPALQHVYFHDGYAVATDAHVLVRVKVDQFGFTDEEIKILHGKFIHRSVFPQIIAQPMINITEDGFDAGNILFRFSDVVEQFPNYAPVIPTEISQVDRIGLDPSKFDQIRKVLGKMSETGQFELQFHGAGKAVTIVPIGKHSSEALGLVTPVILND